MSLNELSAIEMNLTQLNQQKQQIQMQLSEIESAMQEMKGKSEAYKIIGTLMIKKPCEELEKDLKQKQDFFMLKIKSIESQEEKLREKAKELQQTVVQDLKEKESGKHK